MFTNTISNLELNLNCSSHTFICDLIAYLPYSFICSYLHIYLNCYLIIVHSYNLYKVLKFMKI